MAVINGKKTLLGYFDTKEECLKIYDQTVKDHREEFSAMNYQDQQRPQSEQPSTM